MRSVAVGIFCKTPAAGFSKTRLSPPLHPADCSAISACFIRDLATTIRSLGGNAVPYAVYTPVGTEPVLRALLPSSFQLCPRVTATSARDYLMLSRSCCASAIWARSW